MAEDFSEDDELAQQYIEWTSDTVTTILNNAKDKASDGGLDAAMMDEIYQQAHNIKGMGSSFNFPLMTEIGTLLCGYIKNSGDGPWDDDLVLAHLKSFDVVMQHAITGDGGDKGKALLARLSGRVADASAG